MSSGVVFPCLIDERTKKYRGIDLSLIYSMEPNDPVHTQFDQAIDSLINTRRNRGGPPLPVMK